MPYLTETLQLEIVSLAEQLSKEKNAEAKALLEIADDARFGAEKKLERDVIKYAGIAESNFLEGKQLSVLASAGEKTSSYDFKAMGTTTKFPCSLSCEDGVWEFFLPPTPSIKNGKFGGDVGRYTGYLVKNLISTYEQQIGKIRMLDSPVVVFEYGLSGNSTLSKKYDAENRDNKRALDGMTEKFFNDDNVLAIKTVHYGVVSEKPYTRIFVMEADSFALWLSQNSHW